MSNVSSHSSLSHCSFRPVAPSEGGGEPVRVSEFDKMCTAYSILSTRTLSTTFEPQTKLYEKLVGAHKDSKDSDFLLKQILYVFNYWENKINEYEDIIYDDLHEYEWNHPIIIEYEKKVAMGMKLRNDWTDELKDIRKRVEEEKIFKMNNSRRTPKPEVKRPEPNSQNSVPNNVLCEDRNKLEAMDCNSCEYNDLIFYTSDHEYQTLVGRYKSIDDPSVIMKQMRFLNYYFEREFLKREQREQRLIEEDPTNCLIVINRENMIKDQKLHNLWSEELRQVLFRMTEDVSNPISDNSDPKLAKSAKRSICDYSTNPPAKVLKSSDGRIENNNDSKVLQSRDSEENVINEANMCLIKEEQFSIDTTVSDSIKLKELLCFDRSTESANCYKSIAEPQSSNLEPSVSNLKNHLKECYQEPNPILDSEEEILHSNFHYSVPKLPHRIDRVLETEGRTLAFNRSPTVCSTVDKPKDFSNKPPDQNLKCLNDDISKIKTTEVFRSNSFEETEENESLEVDKLCIGNMSSNRIILTKLIISDVKKPTEIINSDGISHPAIILKLKSQSFNVDLPDQYSDNEPVNGKDIFGSVVLGMKEFQVHNEEPEPLVDHIPDESIPTVTISPEQLNNIEAEAASDKTAKSFVVHNKPKRVTLFSKSETKTQDFDTTCVRASIIPSSTRVSKVNSKTTASNFKNFGGMLSTLFHTYDKEDPIQQTTKKSLSMGSHEITGPTFEINVLVLQTRGLKTFIVNTILCHLLLKPFGNIPKIQFMNDCHQKFRKGIG